MIVVTSPLPLKLARLKPCVNSKPSSIRQNYDDPQTEPSKLDRPLCAVTCTTRKHKRDGTLQSDSLLLALEKASRYVSFRADLQKSILLCET